METFNLVNTVTLDPDPIPLKARMVLFGDRELYHVLSAFDPEFPQLFKVQAEFDETDEWRDENIRAYTRMLAFALIDAPEAAETLLDAAHREARVSGARVTAVPVTATRSGLSAIEKAVKAFGESETDVFYRDLVTRHQDALGTLRRLRSGFAAVAYGRGFLADPEILKKFVGLRDTLLLLVEVAGNEERGT